MNTSHIQQLVEDNNDADLRKYFKMPDTTIDDAEFSQALLTAAENNRAECLATLLSQSNTNLCSSSRKAALESGVRKGHQRIVQLLIDTCHCTAQYATSCGHSVFPLAVKLGHVGIAKCLINSGVEPRKVSQIDGRSCLYTAVSQGNKDLVSLLLKSGCKPSHVAEPSELVEAAGKDHSDIMELLLQCPMSRHNQHTAMYLACKCNSINAVSVLIRHGLSVNTVVYGMSPLHIAASQVNSDLAAMLLSHRADVNLLDTHGRSALYHCCVNSGVESNVIQTAKCLLEAGADANLGDPTSLFIACLKKDLQLVKLLVMNGACAKVPCNRDNGLTPMALSIVKGSKDITKLLIKMCCVQDFNIKLLLHMPPKLSVYPLPYMGISDKSFQALKLLVQSGGRLIKRKFLPRLRLEQVHHPEFTSWMATQMQTPLSLQKLCRRTIRVQLGHGAMNGIPTLGLPNLMQEYLEFADLDDIDFESW